MCVCVCVCVCVRVCVTTVILGARTIMIPRDDYFVAVGKLMQPPCNPFEFSHTVPRREVAVHCEQITRNNQDITVWHLWKEWG